ncbi:hypothetical protein [Streptomyces sp. bgisy154]|uniref:hypothetical protein n=1 Tax=Streptomyces sp. bgisy154 TaxID=3413794 RepID=UPI003D75FF9C
MLADRWATSPTQQTTRDVGEPECGCAATWTSASHSTCERVAPLYFLTSPAASLATSLARVSPTSPRLCRSTPHCGRGRAADIPVAAAFAHVPGWS